MGSKRDAEGETKTGDEDLYNNKMEESDSSDDGLDDKTKKMLAKLAKKTGKEAAKRTVPTPTRPAPARGKLEVKLI